MRFLYASSVGYNFVFNMPLTRHSWRGKLNFPSRRHAFIGLVEGLRSLKTRRPEVTEDSNAKPKSYIYQGRIQDAF